MGGRASSYTIDSGDCALVRYEAGQIPPDFELALSPGAISTAAGSKVSVTVNITRKPGFTGRVTVTPLPRTAGIKPKSAPPVSTIGSSATYKLKVKASTSPGSYELTFVGKDDSGRARQVTLTIAVF